ncbi:hypothetical protein ACP4OV_021305 [Aristida adscensionis]
MEPASGRSRRAAAADVELKPLPKKIRGGLRTRTISSIRRCSTASSKRPSAREPKWRHQVPMPWLVHVSSTPPVDGAEAVGLTGIIIRCDKEKAWILTSYRAVYDTFEEELYHPRRKLAVHVTEAVLLPNNNGMFEADMLFFSTLYALAVLTIKVEAMLEINLPTYGHSPQYADEVSVYALDEDLSLNCINGTIMWLEEDHFVFFSSDLCPCGLGGPVLNHDGDVIGMACDDDIVPCIVGISVINKWIEMHTKFGCFARPRLGMLLSSVELKALEYQYYLHYKYGINGGFVIDKVDMNCTAGKLGIRQGDVITSFNEMSCYLPELEDFLLEIGMAFLDKTKCVNEFKLEVYNLLERTKRTIVLPVEISGGSIN